MAQPRHKAVEQKKKTIIDRLKSSALFILFMIIVAIVDVVAFIFWLSSLLAGRLEGQKIFTDSSFYVFVGIAVFLGLFLLAATLIQRRAHGTRL